MKKAIKTKEKGQKSYIRLSDETFVDLYVENLLSKDRSPDYKLCIEMGISERTLRNKKKKLFEKIVERKNEVRGNALVALFSYIYKRLVSGKQLIPDELAVISRSLGLGQEKSGGVNVNINDDTEDEEKPAVVINVANMKREELESYVTQRLQSTRKRNTTKS